LEAAVASRNADALATLMGDPMELVDHPTGAVYDRQGQLASLHSMLSAEGLRFRQEPLATLGDSLVLCRRSVSASGLARGREFDVGAYEMRAIDLFEVDARGRHRRVESFAADRLGDAVARLYERYAELLPDGAERERAAATARSVAVMLGEPDPERWATSWAPAIEFTDARTVGLGSVTGAGELLRAARTLKELSDVYGWRTHDVLGLRSNALLDDRTQFGTDRASGGAYERRVLLLLVFGSDGLVARMEQFDSDRDAEALARFDELTGDVQGYAELTAVRASARIENAATRSAQQAGEAWEARDWERVASFRAPGFRLLDRRALSQVDLDRDRHLEDLRRSFEMASSRYTSEVLATRGERLALSRLLWSGAGRSTGPSEIEWLEVAELDDDGRFLTIVTFDPEDLDAAYAELDARYAAGEGAAHGPVSATMRAFRSAFAARDWEALAALFTPDLVVNDHRRLGWETLRGPAAYVKAMQSLVDLAPDARLRLDHVRTSDRALFWVAGWLGTREGGAFEAPWIVVSEHDALGRVRRFDQYDLEELDAARARFARALACFEELCSARA
jgi:hypothetical protein